MLLDDFAPLRLLLLLLLLLSGEHIVILGKVADNLLTKSLQKPMARLDEESLVKLGVNGLEASPYSVGSFIGPNGKPVDPPWDTLASAQETVGRRVRLYWGGDKKWYAGKIVLVHPTSRQVFIKYDDHDERWHKMWEECYEFLAEEKKPPRGPTPPRRSLATRLPR